jgi:DNA-directed RNA polymerase sigma subunit (sigma70/sigma32)
MSSRRKSPAKLRTPNSPDGVPAPYAPSPKQIANLERIEGKGSTTKKAESNATPTLKLQAAAPKPMTDLTLEQLLEIKPISVQEETVVGKSEATSERVDEAKEGLGKLECEIISALFPASGSPEPLEKIAERLGMTVKEVREVADNALRGLRGTKSSRHRLSTVWN